MRCLSSTLLVCYCRAASFWSEFVPTWPLIWYFQQDPRWILGFVPSVINIGSSLIRMWSTLHLFAKPTKGGQFERQERLSAGIASFLESDEMELSGKVSILITSGMHVEIRAWRSCPNNCIIESRHSCQQHQYKINSGRSRKKYIRTSWLMNIQRYKAYMCHVLHLVLPLLHHIGRNVYICQFIVWRHCPG